MLIGNFLSCRKPLSSVSCTGQSLISASKLWAIVFTPPPSAREKGLVHFSSVLLNLQSDWSGHKYGQININLHCDWCFQIPVVKSRLIELQSVLSLAQGLCHYSPDLFPRRLASLSIWASTLTWLSMMKYYVIISTENQCHLGPHIKWVVVQRHS